MSARPLMPRSIMLAATALFLSLSISNQGHAEPDDNGPSVAYANLPNANHEADVAKTAPTARTLSGFYASVDQGNIVLRESAPTKCLPDQLREVVASIASRFGPVSVESTHRTSSRNWRAGGARQSLHLSCRAIDFRVHARSRGVMAFLRSRPEVGGLKVYGNGIIHIDNGERRSW